VPHLFGTISSRAKKHTFSEALTDLRWVADIGGALTVIVLNEYLGLRNLLTEVVLSQKLRILTFGNSHQQGNIQLSEPMRLCLLELSNSIPGRGSGIARHQGSVSSSCG
jgi:hypothetical protein